MALSLLVAVTVPASAPAAWAHRSAGQEQAQDDAESCRQRIGAVLDRILSRNLAVGVAPPRNAFQSLNPSALAQAEALDRAIAAGQARGPLHCLPVAVKDNVASFDLPMTVGSLALLGNQPLADAPLLARLRAAGAILVGKTTMDEFAFGIRGLSGAAGRVGNAINPWMSAGGSSSGSGVAVGASFVPLAVGSDNCGSLRLPAVYNGAVSLRPSQDRFDSEGVFPIGVVNGTPGLIARDLPMLERGLAVIGGDWRPDLAEQPGALAGRRIGLLRRAGTAALDPTNPEARRLLEQAVALLRSAGAEVVNGLELPAFDPRLGPGFVRGATPRIDALLASYPASRRSWEEVCGSGRIPPEWSAAHCLELLGSDAVAERDARRQMATNRRHLERLLAEQRLDALLLLPDRQGGARSEPSEAITCFVSSASGVPAVVLPIGMDQRGMPVGVELLGATGRDEDLVAMATALEAERGPLPVVRVGANADVSVDLSIPAHNQLVTSLGWLAHASRRGEALGDLEPGRFRELTRLLLSCWSAQGWGKTEASLAAAGSDRGRQGCGQVRLDR